MILKRPKELYWTTHSIMKMRFYGLSRQRISRVLHSPGRVEEGIAPDTVAYMHVAGNAAHPYELWVMVQDESLDSAQGKSVRRKVISAWKYPGRTKPGAPLPAAIMREIEELTEGLRS